MLHYLCQSVKCITLQVSLLLWGWSAERLPAASQWVQSWFFLTEKKKESLRNKNCNVAMINNSHRRRLMRVPSNLDNLYRWGTWMDTKVSWTAILFYGASEYLNNSPPHCLLSVLLRVCQVFKVASTLLDSSKILLQCMASHSGETLRVVVLFLSLWVAVVGSMPHLQAFCRNFSSATVSQRFE